MDEKTIRAILAALAKGQRVELTPQKDGSIRVRTVWRLASFSFGKTRFCGFYTTHS